MWLTLGLLVAFLRTALSLICFTDQCPSGSTLCAVACGPQFRSCVRVMRPLKFPPAIFSVYRQGCSTELCNSTTMSCTAYPAAVQQVCCCDSDYCNEDTPQSDAIYPKFSYRMDPPKMAVPPTTKSILCYQ